MLALAALSREVRESLLECEPEDFHVDVVAELLSYNEEEVTEDESCEQVNDVRATGEQGHARLVNEGKEGDGGEHVEFDSAQLLEDHV